ncbi:5'-nucleotidase, lipoprotein e(P4) family [Labilibaculum filiforme]|uniref:5'-nucleotidase, lipoprotein e(P4) family n=1 Tax=Labilibaculum filiforme TaxID=1940526 RepID=A0A2N3HZM5_9BACT|nr:5'-nucleotidase, lipoprotein e(P4) family [Labilibaculum filiforme]PKQ63516.1 5'-nucleotidase, lipoprotein e(P4) family [Labilibaculum filiforme]
MRKIFFALIAVPILISSCSKSIYTQKQENNTNEHLVMATLWFQRASECRALYYQAFNIAKLSLDNQLASQNENSLPKAVVVDIDETVLDNSPFETNSIRTGQSFTSEAWTEWTDMAKASPTPGALEFLNYAATKGVETFYISNRDTSALTKTIENLQKLGFPFADKQHVLLKTDTSVKTPRRNKVLESHEILILAGDNLGDFDEFLEDRSTDFGFSKVDKMQAEFGNRFIVLPNPMYGSWEKEVLKSKTKLDASEKEKLRKKRLIGYEEL